MAIYRRPGIYVDEVLNPSVAPSGVSGSIAAFVGTNNRGPTTPVLVNSWAEYVANFGGFNTNWNGLTGGNLQSALPFAVYQFFANGGRSAYVNRAVNSDAVPASITLYDGVGNLTANQVLKITALNVGAWAGGSTTSTYTYGLGFDVIRTGASPYRFDLNVYYFPAGVTPNTATVANAQYLVEKFQDLSMNPSDARYAPNIINSSVSGSLSTASSFGGSNYISVTDMGNTANPYMAPAAQGLGVSSSTIPLTISANGVAQAATTNLNSVATLGTDGTAVLLAGNAGSATKAYYLAVAAFDLIRGNLVMNLPAVSDPYTLAPVIDYCGNRGDIFLVIDPPAGAAPDNTGVLANFQALVDPNNGTAYSNNPLTAASNGNKPQVTANLGYASIYYPWIVTGDPSSATPGVTRNLPPGGAVIGAFQKNDATRGPWFAPAGLNVPLAAVSVEQKLSNTQLDGLNNPAAVYPGANIYPSVNAIRVMPGSGVCIYGARTIRTGYADKYVNIRRTLIDVKYNLTQLTQFAVFQPNDNRLWTQLAALCSEYLTGVWQRGGLRGATPQQAFFVKCDATINTPATVANGEVHVQVGIAVQYPAEYVIISIGQFDGGNTVSES